MHRTWTYKNQISDHCYVLLADIIDPLHHPAPVLAYIIHRYPYKVHGMAPDTNHNLSWKCWLASGSRTRPNGLCAGQGRDRQLMTSGVLKWQIGLMLHAASIETVRMVACTWRSVKSWQENLKGNRDSVPPQREKSQHLPKQFGAWRYKF
ncbi:hypothetical protein BRADI_3g00374v3 [Brachypodium distachyon]|uniref:Uncharacterized protein n=1 Tax=Brachypodium distachyon TaxID=15368 RepID=A0A2K2CUG0_BRADI|nr:hypothetical protein BRADI_3g00374v3 [Brachypodium distachyon]